MREYSVVIIGGGPAGLAAAISCYDSGVKDILVIEKGEIILLMLALVIQFQVNQVITMGCLRGAGDAKFVAFISLITITFIRPIGTYVLAYGVGLGLVGAWLSIYLDQITRLLTSKYRFNQAEWMKIQV